MIKKLEAVNEIEKYYLTLQNQCDLIISTLEKSIRLQNFLFKGGYCYHQLENKLSNLILHAAQNGKTQVDYVLENNDILIKDLDSIKDFVEEHIAYEYGESSEKVYLYGEALACTKLLKEFKYEICFNYEKVWFTIYLT